MYGLDERVKRMVRELEPLIYSGEKALGEIEIRMGKLDRGVNPISVEDGWKPYQNGSPWSMPGADEYALFRTKLVIPSALDGKAIAIRCRTNKTGVYLFRPQFLFYVDGTIRQAFDVNHTVAHLIDKAAGGCTYLLHLAAFGGMPEPGHEPDIEPVRLDLSVMELNRDVWDLFFDLKAPLLHSAYLEKDSAEWGIIIETLNSACSLLDLRRPGSAEFHESVRQASQYLRENFYDSPKNTLPVTISCIGQTHIDIAWLWRYCHTREKAARSFATALELMDEYPQFIFLMSQPQLFEFIKEDYPELYERVKEKVREGRLEAEGGMWVEPDANLVSGESFVRQFLYGKKFFRNEFGKDSKILWLPDVFGYSAALPQIMKKCGVDYFFTGKLRVNEMNKMPTDTFIWKGIDGTGVLTHLINYIPCNVNGQPHTGEMSGCWGEYKDKKINNDILYTYGFGDGGGGPTREMIESVKRFEKGLPGAARTRFVSAGEYYKELEARVEENKRLPVWNGELYFEHHRGTYTSMARNKRNNRKAEFLLSNMEWASVLRNELLGTPYPAAKLDAGWKTVLLNQFHDVLPGSSIKEVYDDSDKMYADFFAGGNDLLSGALSAIASSIHAPAGSVIAFNPLSWPRDTAVFFDAPAGDWALSDGSAVYPAQKCANGGYVCLVTALPSKGWQTYQIIPGKPADKIRASASSLENRYLSVDLDKEGNISRLFDKIAHRDVLRPGQPGNRLIAFEDKSHGINEDNWNIDAFYTEKSWEIPAESIELVEQGPVRAVVCVKRPFMNSLITQYIILWANSPRLDFETTADWKDIDLCVKAEFPVDVNADTATYEIQYGHVTRNVHANTSWDQAKFEVCGHKWADLSDGGYGMSLLNDCKYGYDALDGNLRLTLLRSTCFPNPLADKEVHHMAYSILPHAGDFRRAGTIRQAYDLNVPALVAAGGGKGALPPRFSFAEVSDENVILEVVKQAENGDGIIVRLYDAWNKSGKCLVKFFKGIISASECNLLEETTGSGRVDGDTLIFDYKPFEIKTFRVKFA